MENKTSKAREAQARPSWLNVFPALMQIEDPVGREICDSVTNEVALARGSEVFRIGAPCEAYLLCIEGTVRVFKRSIDGREILLYRVHAGQSCALTTGCLMSNKPYPASSITENDVKAVVIGKADFFKGLTASPGFRDFVLSGYGDQLIRLMTLVKGLAFDSLDVRIAEHLLRDADDSGEVHTTHQSLAAELGSVREVVSRELKFMREKNWVEVKRGSIRILDRNSLSELVLSHFS